MYIYIVRLLFLRTVDVFAVFPCVFSAMTRGVSKPPEIFSRSACVVVEIAIVLLRASMGDPRVLWHQNGKCKRSVLLIPRFGSSTPTEGCVTLQELVLVAAKIASRGTMRNSGDRTQTPNRIMKIWTTCWKIKVLCLVNRRQRDFVRMWKFSMQLR